MRTVILRRIRRTARKGVVAILASTLLSPVLLGGEGREMPDLSLRRTFVPPSTGAHPLGRLMPDRQGHPRVVIRDLELKDESPALPGERVVLSTIGVERDEAGQTEFYPFLSVLVDETFEEAPGGQWLAVWNMGHRPPGFLSQLRALTPGWISRKRPDDGKLRELGTRIDAIENRGVPLFGEIPEPTYSVDNGLNPAIVRLTLNSLKIGMGFFQTPFWGQFLFRGYLLRRNDYLERMFQHTYTGLIWYADHSAAARESLQVSAPDVRDIKFRMLSNRSMWGRWVKFSEEEDFVHGYESQMRDHMWGTSNRLASDANQYHLGFEEFHRFDAQGVPVALGGILYYDPKIAPEREQQHWSIANPFDLTYNPFEEEAVVKQAEDGDPVPLAVYTYYSNMALKPIITVDFFRPNNPRLRQAATYWRRLGNEALGSASLLGFFYNGLRRGLSFAANRKGITWLSDSKVALGVEELRLSLMSGLYFEEETGDRILDRVDRMVINPLIQAGREQRLRAQLQYLALTAKEGRATLNLARRLREGQLRKSVPTERGALQERDFRAYGRFLRREALLRKLEQFLDESYLPSMPAEELEETLFELGYLANGQDEKLIETLNRFRLTALDYPASRVTRFDPQRLVTLTEESLGRIYRATGRGMEQFESDLARMEGDFRIEAEKNRQDRLKTEADYFGQELNSHLGTLEALVVNEGDLMVVAPWYVSRAANFFSLVPQAISSNPYSQKRFKKKEQKVEELLAQSRQFLARANFEMESRWLEEERRIVLAAIAEVDAKLQASLQSVSKRQPLATAGSEPRE